MRSLEKSLRPARRARRPLSQVIKLTLLYGIGALKANYGERAFGIGELRDVVGARP